MKNSSTLFACLAPLEAHWGLGALPVAGAHMLIIGWRLADPRYDGGVPDRVALALARAFTAASQLSFMASDATASDINRASATVRTIKPCSLIERAEAVIANEPVNINLVSTHSPDTAVRLFEDFAHCWHMQGQLGLLSAPALLPAVERKTLLMLMSGSYGPALAGLRAQGVHAIVRPGIEGGIAGVLSLSDECTGALLPALEREAQRAGMAWQIMGERDFTSALVRSPTLAARLLREVVTP